MAPPSGSSTDSLRDRLRDAPGHFEFFQAVRLLRRIDGRRQSIGRDADPADECVRLCVEPSFSFPTSDLVRIEPGARAGDPPRLFVSFFGVTTPSDFGSLPTPYVQLVLARDREKDGALREFLDLFHHRMLSLFHRAYERMQPVLSEESDAESYFVRALKGILGIAEPGLSGRMSIPDRALFSRAGLLATAPVSSVSLEQLLRSYLGTRAQVEQFVVKWAPLQEADQNRLGAANSTLGDDLCVGAMVPLMQDHFRVRLGPMHWAEYRAMLPDRDALVATLDLVRLAVGPDKSFEVVLVLLRDEVPELELATAPGIECRLGWSSWISSRPRARDAADAWFSSDDPPAPPPCTRRSADSGAALEVSP